MTRLFVGNFSFEQSLAGSENLSRPVARLEAELAWIWLAVADDGDEILSPIEFESTDWGHFRDLGCPRVRALSPASLSTSKATRLVPWGWTPRVRALAKSLGIPVHAPDQETVQRVNSRAFGAELSQRMDALLPGEGVASSLEEAVSLVENLIQQGEKWIIKPNHGQAGRGQIRGDGPLQDRARVTVERMIARGPVHVEPVLTPVMEVGGQWDIPCQGEPKLVGLTRLFSRENGGYAGTAFDLSGLSDELGNRLISLQARAVAEVQQEGYFGPVGIDAMIFQSQNGIRVRAIQDLNARWTMGRIAWEWSRCWQTRFPASRSERDSPHPEMNGHFCDEMTSSPVGDVAEGIATSQGRWISSASPLSPKAILLSPETLGGLPVQNRIWWEPPLLEE